MLDRAIPHAESLVIMSKKMSTHGTLVQSCLTSPPTRKPPTEITKINFLAQSPETGRSLVVLLGKREVWRERTLFIEKKGFSLSTSLPAFQSYTPPKVLGKTNLIKIFKRKKRTYQKT